MEYDGNAYVENYSYDDYVELQAGAAEQMENSLKRFSRARNGGNIKEMVVNIKWIFKSLMVSIATEVLNRK